MHIIETRIAPNPRRVRIFLAEKGITVAFQELDLMAGDTKTEAFTRINPWQRVPVLVLDDGRTLSESVAICRYFEELQPAPALFVRPRHRRDVAAARRAWPIQSYYPGVPALASQDGRFGGSANRSLGRGQ